MASLLFIPLLALSAVALHPKCRSWSCTHLNTPPSSTTPPRPHLQPTVPASRSCTQVKRIQTKMKEKEGAKHCRSRIHKSSWIRPSNPFCGRGWGGGQDFAMSIKSASIRCSLPWLCICQWTGRTIHYTAKRLWSPYHQRIKSACLYEAVPLLYCLAMQFLFSEKKGVQDDYFGRLLKCVCWGGGVILKAQMGKAVWCLQILAREHKIPSPAVLLIILGTNK